MKWRVLLHMPSFPVEKQKKIIIACIALHNFIRDSALSCQFLKKIWPIYLVPVCVHTLKRSLKVLTTFQLISFRLELWTKNIDLKATKILTKLIILICILLNMIPTPRTMRERRYMLLSLLGHLRPNIALVHHLADSKESARRNEVYF